MNILKRLSIGLLTAACILVFAGPQLMETANASFILNPNRFAAAGGGPLADIKTDLEAWYDFTADGNDSTANGHDLDPTGTAAYGGGAWTNVTGSIRFATPAGLVSSTPVWAATSGDAASFALSWTSVDASNGDYVLFDNNGWKTLVRYIKSGGPEFELRNLSGSGDVTLSDGNDYVTVFSYDGVDTVTCYVNGTEAGTGSGTWTTSGPFKMPRDDVTGTFTIDWLAFWTRELTVEEMENLTDANLTYAELP